MSVICRILVAAAARMVLPYYLANACSVAEVSRKIAHVKISQGAEELYLAPYRCPNSRMVILAGARTEQVTQPMFDIAGVGGISRSTTKFINAVSDETKQPR